ncbi:MAG: hypothetical protein J7J44_09020 [Deltaproteobacteria bacterium]|nr:hypothetical protein [Deltaproteobacteria bacterium]
MKLSKVLVVLSLVMGLVFISASAKATVNMVTEQLGNGAICYFEASESVSTVISILNTDDADQWVHVMVWNHKSQHLKDHPWFLSENGTLVLLASYDSTSEKVIIKPIGGDAVNKALEGTDYYDVTQLTLVPGTGADNIQEISTGVYGGYIQLVAVNGKTDVATLANDEGSVLTNILYVTTALISEPNWWVGLPTYMLQMDDSANDLYQSGTGYIAKGAVKKIDYVNSVDATTGAILYGRWYASDTVKGTVVLVTPAKYNSWSDKITDVTVCDESQSCTSYPAIEIYEVTRNTDLLETAGDDFSDHAGWVELDNATMNTVGFILEEEAGKCDMLPMAKKEK